MRTIAWHEYETACGGGPFIPVAEAGELAREKIEHLVLTGVHMFMDGQSRLARSSRWTSRAPTVIPKNSRTLTRVFSTDHRIAM